MKRAERGRECITNRKIRTTSVTSGQIAAACFRKMQSFLSSSSLVLQTLSQSAGYQVEIQISEKRDIFQN